MREKLRGYGAATVNIRTHEAADALAVCLYRERKSTSGRRMREKLREYAAEGAAWPVTASILDPVRLSVVCDGPAHIVQARPRRTRREQGRGGGANGRLSRR